MKCKNCGFEFDGGIFCPECGTKYDVEEARRQADELKAQEELHRQEKIKERELEVEKAKAEQERLANERIQYELELEKQKAEIRNLELDAKERETSAENKKNEEQERTYKGVVYSTVDDKNLAQQKDEEQKLKDKIPWYLTLWFNFILFCVFEVFFYYGVVICLVLLVIRLKKYSKLRWLTVTFIVFDVLWLLFGLLDTITKFIS